MQTMTSILFLNFKRFDVRHMQWQEGDEYLLVTAKWLDYDTRGQPCVTFITGLGASKQN